MHGAPEKSTSGPQRRCSGRPPDPRRKGRAGTQRSRPGRHCCRLHAPPHPRLQTAPGQSRTARHDQPGRRADADRRQPQPACPRYRASSAGSARKIPVSITTSRNRQRARRRKRITPPDGTRCARWAKARSRSRRGVSASVGISTQADSLAPFNPTHRSGNPAGFRPKVRDSGKQAKGRAQPACNYEVFGEV